MEVIMDVEKLLFSVFLASIIIGVGVLAWRVVLHVLELRSYGASVPRR
jgi:hypothetical protein